MPGRKSSRGNQKLSQAKLQVAFASMTEAVFIADAEGQLTDFNDEFVRYHQALDRSIVDFTSLSRSSVIAYGYSQSR
jgi:hypothetical protein